MTRSVMTVAFGPVAGNEDQLVRVKVEPKSSSSNKPLLDGLGLSEGAMLGTCAILRGALGTLGIELNDLALTVSFQSAGKITFRENHELAAVLAMLVALERVPPNTIHDTVVLGKLSLDGRVRPVRGVLPALMVARREGVTRAIVPHGNAAEAAAAPGIKAAYEATSLKELVATLNSGTWFPIAKAEPYAADPLQADLGFDFSEVRGLPHGRIAMEIAAAGHHNVALIGTPGCGKTMLARRLPSILPPMTHDEALAVTCAYSSAGLLRDGAGLMRTRPFRAPHHTASAQALTQEAALSQHGVLFLDEFLEYRHAAIENLSALPKPKQPLLVVAINPCPCGYFGSSARPCKCSPNEVSSYLNLFYSSQRCSSIDLCATLSPLTKDDAPLPLLGESSATIRQRVTEARAIQRARFDAGTTSAPYNAHLSLEDLDRVAIVQSDILDRLAPNSVLGKNKLRRIARTIADLDKSYSINGDHIEAFVAATNNARLA